MKAVLEVFFQKIPSIIFEPVAICGLIGLILALVTFRKEWKGKFYLFFCISLLFMFFWRLAIQIMSSRYGLILMIPFTIATSFLFFKMEYFCSLIPKFPEKFLRYVPYFCLSIMVIICLCTTFTSDRTQTYRKTGLETAQDIKKCKEQKLFSNPIIIDIVL